MDIERLKELKGITEQLYQDGNVPLTYCDDVLELIDEAITNQPVTKSATSEDVGMVIKLMQAYGKNITSKCQIEGTIFYDTGSPCTRHRFGEDTIDTIITALQAYQPTVSKTETTNCEWCEIASACEYEVTFFKDDDRWATERSLLSKYCPNCGRKVRRIT